MRVKEKMLLDHGGDEAKAAEELRQKQREEKRSALRAE